MWWCFFKRHYAELACVTPKGAVSTAIISELELWSACWFWQYACDYVVGDGNVRWTAVSLELDSCAFCGARDSSDVTLCWVVERRKQELGRRSVWRYFRASGEALEWCV